MKKRSNQLKKDGKAGEYGSRESEICRKALDLFIKKGYNGTSMSMISKALGMSKANLYHHFTSKEDLFYKIHVDYLQSHLIPVIEEAECLHDPKDRIAFILKQLTLLTAKDRATRVLIPDIPNLNKAHHQEITEIFKRAYELVRNSIKELQRSGRAHKFRASFMALLGFGMANSTVYWFDYGRQVNAKELSETVVETFLNGLLYSEKSTK